MSVISTVGRNLNRCESLRFLVVNTLRNDKIETPPLLAAGLASAFFDLLKELANYYYSAYNVLQINTLEVMYEQGIISKSH